MSDAIKHECGIALLQLKKPLSFYKEKYGSSFYGINKMYLLMEKQHNRGQDGAGFASIKFDMSPGQRYISRVRSADQQPIQNIFKTINTRIQKEIQAKPEIISNSEQIKSNIPYVGELMLGHVRYGTFGKNNIESVHPFLRQNNWMHRNLIVAGNFNLTNVNELFENLVDLGQHPKEKADTITVMEKIGHFLDDAVAKIYKKLRKEGYSKQEASPLIAERLKISKILRKASKNWDGGYAMAGLLGHGDAFVLRDPAGIRPSFWYEDDEVCVVASERPVIQTAFNLKSEQIQELKPGHAIIIKKDGRTSEVLINEPTVPAKCSFERIYFSRGNDADIYHERKKLGKVIVPQILDSIDHDLANSVFSFIPNTAETSFYGMIKGLEDHLNEDKIKEIIALGANPNPDTIREILLKRARVEKIAIKDAKLRTFITQDDSRDDLVAHIYDITYGSVRRKSDNLVIIDDSIVRGTTLKQSILRILDRLEPKKIVVVSSAPQIRYPDCYGIDMAKMGDFIAFEAAIALLQDSDQEQIIDKAYHDCLEQAKLPRVDQKNAIQQIYEPFTNEQISRKISELLTPPSISAEVIIIYQTVENLHKACPNNTGDWYFTGNYPTPGGNKVVNKAFINWKEGILERAY
ncbi:MAG: amidophosphoribosyltransferase [Flavobacteriaceae bacterium]|nr:amidophosphoribosyltransferase [Flavobacteriaceae bacterium]